MTCKWCPFVKDCPDCEHKGGDPALREPFAGIFERQERLIAEAKERHAARLARTNLNGEPLYRVTSGGNVVRTRPIKSGLKMRILRRDGFACVECGAKEELQVAHIEDYAINGNNDDDNLRTLCSDCHVIESRTKAAANKYTAGSALPQSIGDSIGWSN